MADLDCTTCGACCFLKHHDDGYTPLTDAGLKRIPIEIVTVHKRFKLPVLRDKPRHDGVVCIALRGQVGRNVSCEIYEDRPTFCRQFKPRSRACHAARKVAGIT